jgi:hypothetical protein
MFEISGAYVWHTHMHTLFGHNTTCRVIADVPDGPHIDGVAQGGLATYLVTSEEGITPDQCQPPGKNPAAPARQNRD